MQSSFPQPVSRSFGSWVLLLVAVAASLLGGFILLATALGFGHVDVRGVRLEGAFELFFLAGLGVAVALAGVAAAGFIRRRPWAVGLLAAAWPSFALVCLVLDRIAPAPGPGRPLAFYILGVGLLPAAITLLLGRVANRSRARFPGFCVAPRHSASIARHPQPSRMDHGTRVRSFRNVLLLALLSACGPQAETSRDSLLEWTILEVRELRDPDGAMSPQPWGIATDPALRRVYVADAPNQRILVFNADGTLVDQWGRSGSGPGEFGEPWALSRRPDGSLTVLDIGLHRISRWSPTGEWLSSEPAPASYWGPEIVDLGDRLVLVATPADFDPREIKQDLVIVGDSTALIRSVSQQQATIRLDCLQAPTPVPKPIAPEPVWSTKGDTVLVLRGLEYAIDLIHDGEVVRSYERDLPPVEVTEEMALERIENGQLRIFIAQCGVDAQTVSRSMNWQETVAPVRRIVVSPDGRLWASRTGSTLRRARVDVFEPDGRYIGTIPDVPDPVAFLAPDEFVAFGAGDQFGVTLQLLRIALN